MDNWYDNREKIKAKRSKANDTQCRWLIDIEYNFCTALSVGQANTSGWIKTQIVDSKFYYFVQLRQARNPVIDSPQAANKRIQIS